MKKIFVFILCLFTCLVLDVHASSNLNMEFQENIYYVRRGGGEYSSNILSFYTIDDKVVYCVEPGVLVNDFNYKEEIGLDNLDLSLETKELISLIGYYGYEYPGHETTRFRMATQALIWEISTGDIVEFYTERYGYGDYIDVSYEKNIIMDLVNSHYIKPTFDGDTFNGYYNMTIASEDANNVLDSYEVLDDGENEVKIENNEITINPLKVGKSKIILKKKKYDNNPSILYIPSNGTSQKVAHLRVDTDELTAINLNIQGAKVEVLKKDSDTLNNPIGDNKLSGAIFGIYDEDNNLIDKIETNSEGKVSKYLALGNYKLKEIEPSYGYLLNYKTYEFSLTKTNLVSQITVYEEAIKKDITIKKVMDNETGILDYEPNITFDIYLKSTNRKIASKTTDQYGYLNIRLPYGIYIFKQRNTTEGYLKADDFEIEINEKTKNIVEKVVVNKKITSKVKVQKVDLETGESINLSGIKFKIKNLDTNEYVCQEITYPNLKTICIFETGLDGSFTTPQGLFGNFQVEEVEQIIPGYNLNKNSIKFSISNEINENIYLINFPNERIKGNLKINKLGEELVIDKEIFYNKIPLPRVKFKLYAKDNIYLGNNLVFEKDELIDTLITNQEGVALLNNLYQGSYYLEEIESANGNLVNEERYYFDITKNDTIVLDIMNYLPKGSLELDKIDSITKVGISNTLIAIYKEDKLIYEGKTNQDGKIVLNNLPIGSYTLKEIESNPDYIKSDNILEFSINEDKEIVKLTLENEKIITGSIKINKLGEELVIDKGISYNKIPLPGVKFKLYAKDNIYLGNNLVFEKDELIDTLKTNQEGVALLNNLYQGSYYLEEIESANGNLVNEERYYFDITKNDTKVLDIMNYLPKGSLELDKIDSITKVGISNTLIAIYKEDNLIYEGKTNQEGKINLTNLPIGSYTLKEIESNPDYIKSDNILEFSINEDKEIVKLTLENEKIITGSIKIDKLGEELVINKGITYNKIPLSGVKINLYANEDIYLGKELVYQKDELIETLVTNEEGIVSLDNLYLGSYYIEEIESSNGNLVNEERYCFDLTYKDQDTNILANINLENYLPKGSLELNKIDSITKEGVPDTLIAVYKENKLIYEGKTDKDGKIILTNLPIGSYSIKELESNPDYIKSDSILEFTINEDKEIINLNLENEKIVQVIEVPNTSKDKIDKLNVMSIILMITGISLIFYVLKIKGGHDETEFVK